MLGPPICMHCKVVYIFVDKKWVCKYCKRTNTNFHYADAKISDEELKANKKFLEFIYHKEKG